MNQLELWRAERRAAPRRLRGISALGALLLSAGAQAQTPTQGAPGPMQAGQTAKPAPNPAPAPNQAVVEDTFEPAPDAFLGGPGQYPFSQGVPNLAEIERDWKPLTDPLPATGVVLFAAPNGQANAPGTLVAPLALRAALEKAPSGATIALRGGKYRDARLENVKLPRAVTLRAYPGEKPWLLGSDVVSQWQREGARFFAAWDKKFNSGAFKAESRMVDVKYPLAAETDMAFLNGQPLGQVTKLENLVPGTFFVDAKAKRLYLSDDPRGKVVEVTARESAFHQSGGRVRGEDGIILRGLGVAHYANHGAVIVAPNTRVEGCVFAWNAEAGLELIGQGVAARDSLFIANGRKGMRLASSRGAVIERNRFAHNNVERFRRAWDAAGLKMGRNRDVVVRNNVFERNWATALWTDVSNLRLTLVGNTVRDNAGIGIMAELGHDNLIAFNVCERNDMGVLIADSSKISVWNNTLVGNGRAITVKDSPRENQPGSMDGAKVAIGIDQSDHAQGATWVAHSNVIKNNLLIGPLASERPKAAALLDAGGGHPKTHSAKMIESSGPNAFLLGTAALAGAWRAPEGKSADYATLADLQAAAPGFEAGSVVLSAARDALFAAPAGGNYRPIREAAILRGAALPPDVAQAAREAGIAVDSNAPFIGALPPA